MKTKICVVCDKEFNHLGRSGKAITCSKECQEKHKKNYNLKRYQKVKEERAKKKPVVKICVICDTKFSASGSTVHRITCSKECSKRNQRAGTIKRHKERYQTDEVYRRKVLAEQRIRNLEKTKGLRKCRRCKTDKDLENYTKAVLICDACIELAKKTCKGPCGELKSLDEFQLVKREKGGDYHQSVCRDCRNTLNREKFKSMSEEEKEILRSRSRKINIKSENYKKQRENKSEKYHENPEHHRALARASRERYLEIYKERSRESHRRAKNELADSYLVTLLTNNGKGPLRRESISPKLIKLKRAEMLLDRMIKEKADE